MKHTYTFSEARLVRMATEQPQPERDQKAVDRQVYGERKYAEKTDGKEVIKTQSLDKTRGAYLQEYHDHFAAIVRRISLQDKGIGTDVANSVKYAGFILLFKNSIREAGDSFKANQEQFESHLRDAEAIFAQLEQSINKNPPPLATWKEKQLQRWTGAFIRSKEVPGYEYEGVPGTKVVLLDIPETWNLVGADKSSVESHDVNSYRRRFTVQPGQLRSGNKITVMIPHKDIYADADMTSVAVEGTVVRTGNGVATLKLDLPRPAAPAKPAPHPAAVDTPPDTLQASPLMQSLQYDFSSLKKTADAPATVPAARPMTAQVQTGSDISLAQNKDLTLQTPILTGKGVAPSSLIPPPNTDITGSVPSEESKILPPPLISPHQPEAAPVRAAPTDSAAGSMTAAVTDSQKNSVEPAAISTPAGSKPLPLDARTSKNNSQKPDKDSLSVQLNPTEEQALSTNSEITESLFSAYNKDLAEVRQKPASALNKAELTARSLKFTKTKQDYRTIAVQHSESRSDFPMMQKLNTAATWYDAQATALDEQLKSIQQFELGPVPQETRDSINSVPDTAAEQRSSALFALRPKQAMVELDRLMKKDLQPHLKFDSNGDVYSMLRKTTDYREILRKESVRREGIVATAGKKFPRLFPKMEADDLLLVGLPADIAVAGTNLQSLVDNRDNTVIKNVNDHTLQISRLNATAYSSQKDFESILAKLLPVDNAASASPIPSAKSSLAGRMQTQGRAKDTGHTS
ncbi:MAG: hypothetical protein JWM56_520 [Candidatus Peribacteria bacterium]|nr:hypothetical protein [Candidatus Peribacteria bacterium]